MQEYVIFPNELLLCCGRPPSVIYINICMWTDLFISLHPPPEVQLVEEEWVGGCRGGHLSSLCGCATVWSRAELPLWAKNTSGMRGQGREKERWRHEERKKNDWGRGLWRDAEMDRECSHAECTLLCSPFPSSRHHPEHEHFFNHSRESRAELSGGRVSHCSVCSIASSPPLPLPRHTAPCLQLSTYPHCSLFPHPLLSLFSPYPSPAPFSYLHLCSISPPFHLTLSPSFVLLVCVTVSFVSFPSLLLCPSLPPFSACSGWMETFCLLQGMLFLPYWPTNRKESQPEMSLGCLFFWLPAMSACQACAHGQARARVCVSHMGCCHHRQRGCCDMSPSFITLEDKTVSLGPHLPKYGFQIWIQVLF